MKISLGGDIVQYLGAIGLFKALSDRQIQKIKEWEIHCSGFSCIPALLWFYSPTNAYNILSNMWEESFKIFPNATTFSIQDFSKNFSMMIKMQKRLDDELSKERLERFVEKWIPEIEISSLNGLKIYSYNLRERREEVLTGNSRDAIMKAITYPIDFEPVDSYISLSWVFGIPEGDVIIYIDWEKETYIRKAADYLLYATLARTFHIMQLRSQKAKKTSVVQIKKRQDFSIISRRFYECGMQLF